MTSRMGVQPSCPGRRFPATARVPGRVKARETAFRTSGRRPVSSTNSRRNMLGQVPYSRSVYLLSATRLGKLENHNTHRLKWKSRSPQISISTSIRSLVDLDWAHLHMVTHANFTLKGKEPRSNSNTANNNKKALQTNQ